ncbi:hypothetical protein C2S51_022767 [Perilla frutescens var. frutescens]|nr:hypothetical protein C2S51_022767 [Perilla frutescens var. frutescens]
MGWSYPEISIEDLMILIKNFIDMLILASGYQSTGRLADWDSLNIKRFFQWALFLENVSKGLLSSADYEDSVKELDALLYELTLDPNFPQDLAHLSCISLSRATDLMLEHLIHTFPLRESHLKGILTASVEMDISKLKRIDNDGLDVYLDKLMLIPSNGPNLSEGRHFGQSLNISTQDAVPSEEHDNEVDGDFSMITIQQLGRRRLAVSCSSTVEVGSENIWKTIRQRMHDELGGTSNSEPVKHSKIGEELPLELAFWNRWRTRSLSYMLEKRTMRMISGASLICSVPEGQWTQMLERLDIPAGSDDFCEMIELLLLGCVADRWNTLLEHLMSVSYEFPTISRLHHEVFSLPLGKSQDLFLNEGLMNAKEKSVVDYLEVVLSSKVNQLWKLSPVLAAIAIPPWSKLFRSYLRELEGQLLGNSLATRDCSCVAGTMEHRECGFFLLNLASYFSVQFFSPVSN